MADKANNCVGISYFTDPLCCWSWAMEPQLRKFRFQFREYIDFEFRMAGLIPSWDNFVDSTNAVSRPAQMGPVWLHAEQISGMPMAHQIWAKDPPLSSFPACVAVKCVMIQSRLTGELYLRMLREACMIKGQNIGKQSVLLEVAAGLCTVDPLFDYELFNRDFCDSSGQKLFRSDWEIAKQADITRLPTIVMQYNDKTVRMSGYKSFASLRAAFLAIRPDLTKITLTEDLPTYRQYWDGITEREFEEFVTDSTIPFTNVASPSDNPIRNTP